MAESYVQVATDGSGKKIRNTTLTESQGVDTSGNAQADLVRYQQTVVIVDAAGDAVDFGALKSIDARLEAVEELLANILDSLT